MLSSERASGLPVRVRRREDVAPTRHPNIDSGSEHAQQLLGQRFSLVAATAFRVISAHHLARNDQLGYSLFDSSDRATGIPRGAGGGVDATAKFDVLDQLHDSSGRQFASSVYDVGPIAQTGSAASYPHNLPHESGERVLADPIEYVGEVETIDRVIGKAKDELFQFARVDV